MTRKRRTFSKLLTTSNQTLYTVPSNFDCDISSILIVNGVTAVRHVDLELYNNSESTFYSLTGGLPLAPNGFVMIDNPLYLKPGDYIRGLADSTDSITVHILTDEQFFAKGA